MTEDEFREAMWSGLGRAILHARDHDTRVFHDLILDACLRCHAVDPTCEGTRADYMYELIAFTPDRDFYLAEVLKSLSPCGDDWDTVHRFWLATRMAMDGDQHAKRAMYTNYNPGMRRGVQIALGFIDLDGIDGALFAADKLGALLISGFKPVEMSWFAFKASESFSEDEIFSALRSAGKSNPRIEAFRLAAEAESKASLRAPEIKTMTYADLRARLPELRHLSWIWGERASPENLALAAHGLLAATTPEDQIQHLKIFRRRAFPFSPDPLFRFVASPDENLADAAAEALSNVTHPSVRDLASELIEQRRLGRDHAILMLSHNWQSGDHEIALRWFEQETDRVVRHRLGLDLRTFWEEHPDAATESRMLLALYERGPCSMCREFLLGRLIELRQLPDHIRRESVYDANQGVRDLVTSS